MVPLSVPDSYTVEVRPGRDGYLGMTHGASREIVLYVSDDHTDREVGATLLHEIGHAYDFLGLGARGDDARRRWAEARGFAWAGRAAWYGTGCQGCSDFSIGAGDLAESVHACWAPGWDRFRSQLAGPPTASQCDLLARILH